MPEVREGSVFEILYSIRSPFAWNLQDWQFQYTIPVKYSEYQVEYPEWFHYNKSFKGYDYNYMVVNDEGKSPGKITFTEFNRRGKYNVQSSANTRSIDYQNITGRWGFEHLPAFKPEAHITSYKNYLTKVDFELASTRFPSGPLNSYTQTWDDISKLLMESSYFGLALGKLKTKFLEDVAISAASTHEDAASKIAAIYYHIRNKMVWNGKQRVQSSVVNLKKAYEGGTGNSADINLSLTAALRWAGFHAHPVILSTRDNGFVNPAHPSINQCNYVITAVIMEDDNIWLLDATDRSLPINLLPPRCINGSGRILTKDGAFEVPLNPSGKYRKASQAKLALNEDGQWTGTLEISRRDYAARYLRVSLANEEGEKYIESLQNDYEGIAVENHSFENLTDLSKETKEHYEVNIRDQTIDGGNMLYFNPMLMFGETENPYKLEDRKYPVDYNYPYELIYSAQFEIPEGYEVVEVPEKAIVSLPEKGGRFVYTINIQGNIINLTNQIKINKHLYLPQEYAGLKEFYNLIVEKHGAQVVLKKKT